MRQDHKVMMPLQMNKSQKLSSNEFRFLRKSTPKYPMLFAYLVYRSNLADQFKLNQKERINIVGAEEAHCDLKICSKKKISPQIDMSN